MTNSKNSKQLAAQVRAMTEQVFENLTRALCPLEETVFLMIKRPGMVLQFEELTVKCGYDTNQAVDILLNSTLDETEIEELYSTPFAREFAGLLKSFPLYFKKILKALEYRSF